MLYGKNHILTIWNVSLHVATSPFGRSEYSFAIAIVQATVGQLVDPLSEEFD